jgi:prepilin-type N-terminal cleavage/methylation domain-containing protein
MRKSGNKGFTLIELLIVIALVAVVAGVSADIVLSVVRSYTKTRSQTEVEQAANFALLKLEKELKSATSMNSPTSVGGSSNEIIFGRSIGGTDTLVTYRVSGGSFEREVNSVITPLLDKNDEEGVRVTSDAASAFTILHNNPYVVQIRMSLRPVSIGDATFDEVDINQTVVLRGTYQ